jgi:hypothetical protein
MARLQAKLDSAHAQLQAAIDEHEQTENEYHQTRDLAIASLQDQHTNELHEHDRHFSGELPVKYQHFSREIRQIRAQ